MLSVQSQGLAARLAWKFGTIHDGQFHFAEATGGNRRAGLENLNHDRASAEGVAPEAFEPKAHGGAGPAVSPVCLTRSGGRWRVPTPPRPAQPRRLQKAFPAQSMPKGEKLLEGPRVRSCLGGRLSTEDAGRLSEWRARSACGRAAGTPGSGMHERVARGCQCVRPAVGAGRNPSPRLGGSDGSDRVESLCRLIRVYHFDL